MRVAVVIPCFNYGRFLAEAVESVVAQSLHPGEIIIVDDGSTDETRDVAQRLIAAHGEISIRLITTPPSGSAGASRNVGVEATAAEYVLCLDADDRLHAGFLQTCVAALDEHPLAAIAYGDILGFDDDGVVQRLCEWDTRQELLVNLVGSASLFRRAAWEQVGGYDTEIGHADWDFWIGCIEHGWVGVRAAGALWHYRVHDGMYSRSIGQDQNIRARIVLKHRSLYTDAQRRWASGVLEADPRALAVASEPAAIPDNAAAARAFQGTGGGGSVRARGISHDREAAAVASPGAAPRLCVGMSTYDDFDGVWFTVQAIRMYQPEVLADLSLLVIDNHPDGIAATPLRELGNWIADYRYIPFSRYNGTAVRDLVFREADAEIVCCVDSHVLLAPGSLAALRAWFVEHPDSRDLLQGPLLHDDLGSFAATHLEPTWGEGMFGQWSVDPRIEDPACQPFEIAMQGLGVFACRRDAWPGLNPRMRGFGGEEGYLQEKFRRHGGRVICHPGLGWVHRFGRPRGVEYTNTWEDRVRNYYIGWSEVGWDPAPMEQHFRELLADAAEGLFEQARLQIEHPLNVFDAVFCIAENAGEHNHPAELAWRIEHLDAQRDGEPARRRLACWREALNEASRRGYEHVLVTEDPGGPDAIALTIGQDQMASDWDVFVLAPPDPRGPSSEEQPADSRAAMTAAVHRRAYARILAEIPADEADQSAFLASHGGFGGYLLRAIADGSLAELHVLRIEPELDRPRALGELELLEVDQGLRVRRHDSTREHQLNNTAAVVLELSDGSRSIVEVAHTVAELFGLPDDPLAEVSECVERLRRVGLVAGPEAVAAEDAAA
jgi:hypothetical protein